MSRLKEFAESIYEKSRRGNIFLGDAISTLHWLERQTHTRTNHAQMLVGEEEGAFLKAFTQEVALERISNNSGNSNNSAQGFKVLEIGTFTGYSLLCFAFALKELSQTKPFTAGVEALEINDELKYLIDQAIAKASVEELVNVHFTDAISYLKEVALQQNSKSCGTPPVMYDIVFIDANKRNYLDYYELALPLLKPGGYILADNVSWYGKILQPDSKQNSKTKGIADFNARIAQDSEKGVIESYLLALRDGLYIIQKL